MDFLLLFPSSSINELIFVIGKSCVFFEVMTEF
jgi:hypothetical protein